MDPLLARVSIHRRALNLIADEATRNLDGLETGGILLGRDEGDQLVVFHSGGPGPQAVRQPARFLRDLAYARTVAESAWDLDRSQWIGEWHTHPNGDVHPSPTDLRSYFGHLADPDLGFVRFLAVIVTVSAEGVVAAAWLVYAGTCYSAAIDVIEES